MGEGLTERFKTKRGVRQGCPLSVPLFIIYLENLKERWKRKNAGGVVTGNKKIYCLKFTDNVAMMADSAEGLREMLKDLERFSEESGLEVNENKTKIMVFRKGGRVGKEKWSYKNKELEVVGEYKYLRFWFKTGNSYSLHIKKMSAKVRKAIKKGSQRSWGVQLS